MAKRSSYPLLNNGFISVPSLTVLFVFILIGLSTNLNASELETTQIPLDDISSGSLYFNHNNHYSTAITQNSDYQLKINGLLAHVTVTQTFKNLSDNFVEGIYVFPLIDDASVSSMIMEIGERKIVGEIKEKKQAKRLYSKAKKQGKKSSLVSQQRPNLFTTKVANIAPGESIKISLVYLQSIKLASNVFSLRIPLTLTPRYIPAPRRANDLAPNKALEAESNYLKSSVTKISAHGWALNNSRVLDASEITPFQARKKTYIDSENKQQTVTLSATLHSALPIVSLSSLYHTIVKTKRDEKTLISLAEENVPLDQDFVLNWQLTQDNTPKAAFFQEIGDEEGEYQHGLLMLMPPKGDYETPIIKEVIYIIDTSGSMGGVSIRQAKQALKAALDLLPSSDSFNIIAFNNNTKQLFTDSKVANTNNISQAKYWLSNLSAGGGTNMYPAIAQALMSPSQPEGYRQIIFITDGSVGNESELFNLIDKNLNNSRLHTIGIGSAPNSYFMTKAANMGRGTYRYIGNINEVNEQMRQLFSEINNPLMKNIKIHWPVKQLEIYPPLIPDLYSGKPLVIAARWLKSESDTDLPIIKITGMLASIPWSDSIEIPSNSHHSSNGNSESIHTEKNGVAQWWASQKINHLLLQQRRSSKQDSEALTLKITHLALTHHLLSPYTSFIAIEESQSRDNASTLKTLPIKNLMPKGSSQVIHLANTSVGLRGYFYLGLCCFIFALMMNFIPKRHYLRSRTKT